MSIKTTGQTTTKIIIDTDPGVDDALATLLAFSSNKFDIKAITTVAGNSTLENVTANAKYIVEIAGMKTKVFAGSPRPLKKSLTLANIHGSTGLANIKTKVRKLKKSDTSAVKIISDLIRRYPNEITIVSIGPETNIAKVLKKDPSLAEIIKEVVIMGGAIDVAGNKSRVAEFNIFVDPDAAKIVFDSPARKTLIPLDVCYKTPFFISDFKKLKGSKYYEFIMKIVKPYIKNVKKFEGKLGAIIYDALTIGYLIDPNIFRIEEMDVRVETRGDLTVGMTVADKRSWGEKAKNISVAIDIDRKKFAQSFITILKSAK